MVQLRVYAQTMLNAFFPEDEGASLTYEEIGRLFVAMLHYSIDKTKIPLSGNERFQWGRIKDDIDAQFASYEDKCERAEKARSSRSKSDNSNINVSDSNIRNKNLTSSEIQIQIQKQIQEQDKRKLPASGGKRERKRNYEEHDLPSKELVDSFFLDLDKLTDSLKAKEI